MIDAALQASLKWIYFAVYAGSILLNTLISAHVWMLLLGLLHCSICLGLFHVDLAVLELILRAFSIWVSVANLVNRTLAGVSGLVLFCPQKVGWAVTRCSFVLIDTVSLNWLMVIYDWSCASHRLSHAWFCKQSFSIWIVFLSARKMVSWILWTI